MGIEDHGNCNQRDCESLQREIPQEPFSFGVKNPIEKVPGEKIVRREIESGSSSTDVFNRYGIL